MQYASATKDQMKAWKSAAKPDKDYPERSTNRIMFKSRKDEKLGVYITTLVASDGYQLIKRNITSELDAKQHKMAIPRGVMEAAEKTMKKGDRAYFSDGKITVRSVSIDETTEEEITVVRGVFPFVEQLDLFSDFETAMESFANKELPERICTLDAKILKQIVEQLRSGDARVFVKVHFRESPDGLQPVVMQAFEGIEEEELTAVIMPIRE